MNNFNTQKPTNKCSIDLLARKSYELSLKILADTIERIDEEIKKHPQRKMHYSIKGFYQRTITTKYGTITYNRRLYLDKRTYQYEFLVDKLIGVEAYSRFSDEAIMAIAEAAIENKSYRLAGLQALSGTIVSRQSVYNCIAKVDFIRKQQAQKVTADTINISIDGFYSNYQDFKKKIETKFANIFTGIEKVGKKRNRLLNRMIINQTNQYNFKKELIKGLDDYYDITDKTKIIISGDGASFIKALTNEIPNSRFVIDRFHYIKALRSLPDPIAALEAFHSGNLEQISRQISLCTSDAQRINLQYVIDNYKYTVDWKNKDFICCAAENVVSHVYNIRLRGVPRNWGNSFFKIASGLALKATDSLLISLNSLSNARLIDDNKNINDFFYSFNYSIAKESFPLFNYKKICLTSTIKKLIY